MNIAQKIVVWLHNLRLASKVAHADTALKHGDFARTIRLCDLVITHEPPAPTPLRVDAYTLRGRARHRLGDEVGSLSDFAAALRLDPRSSALHQLHGVTALAQGDYPEALASFNLAVYYNPKDAAAHINRGLVNELTGNLDGAINEYTIAIRLNPHIDFAYTNRGGARALWGDLRGAIADYQYYLILGGGWRHGDQDQVESRIAALQLQLESGT